MIENTIICVSWGDKYDRTYVKKLKEQCEANCSIPFNFYCITDRPKLGSAYDISMPRYWDKHYIAKKHFFWAYRKCYMFSMGAKDSKYFFSRRIKGEKFLFLDLDLIIHQDLKYFFDLPMDKPYIVRGWWNDSDTCKKNFAKYKSTPLNSSVIRWNRGQLIPVWQEIYDNPEMIFFTYPSIDNYFNHRWYNTWDEDSGFFQGFPKGDIYSWYKGNIFPDDMELNKTREDHKICLFNNSTQTEGENDDEMKTKW